MGIRFQCATAAAAVVVVMAAAGGCQEPIPLTNAPVIGPAPVEDSRRALTPVFLGLPVDVSGLVRLADAAIPESLPPVVEWIGSAACGREGSAVRCTTARIDLEIERAGAPVVVASRGDLTLEVPIRYHVVGRGTGWAQHIAESASGELTASVDFAVEMTPSFVTRINVKDEVRLSRSAVPVLDGEVPLVKHIGPRLRRAIVPAGDALAAALAAEITRAKVDHAWRALHSPVEINRELHQWLRAEPMQLVPGGFAAADGGIAWRLAIVSRLQVFTGDRPSPLPPKPAPELSTGPAAQRTVLRLPAILPWDRMQSAVERAFPPGETIRSDGPGESPLEVVVRRVDLVPAREQLGIEFDLEVVEPEALRRRRGIAHVVATPVVRPATSRLELEQIGFPNGPDRPRRQPSAGISPAEAARTAQVPVLSIEPFARKLTASAHMDISNALRDVLPHTNSLFERPLGPSFELHGRFDSVSVSRVRPVRQGFELMLDIGGALTLLPAAPLPRPRDGEVARGNGEQ